MLVDSFNIQFVRKTKQRISKLKAILYTFKTLMTETCTNNLDYDNVIFVVIVFAIVLCFFAPHIL